MSVNMPRSSSAVAPADAVPAPANADGPLSQLIDSAGDKVGSLFGIPPLVMEREGATVMERADETGNAAASKPTPQPTPSLPDLHPRAALAQAAPPSVVRAPAGPVSCRFWMIKADFLRTFSGTNLPFFQELRAKHPSAFVEVTISYEEVVRGTHVEKILSISHRWMEPTQPDPDGEQLKAIKAFLVSSAGKRIELVWIDGGSMPQHQPTIGLIRSDEDTADFKTMLSEVCAALCLGHRPFPRHPFPATQPPMFTPRHCSPPFTCAQVNMLYLGTTVLILFDLSYLSRFWTQFEAWLSMQFATPNGLKSAVGTIYARHHIVCIQNAADQSELYTKALTDQWATKTPQQAFDFLSKPDVTVTNTSDKQGQLPKIKALDATVQGAFQAIMEHESSASEPFYQGFHPGITCGRSGMKPIVGMRFHLRGIEPSSDLCQAEYDKLDDAEKGLYEAIPPPQPLSPGLKLEGGSLEGAAAEYMGEYRLAVDDRVRPHQAGEAGWRGGPILVNSRPAWRHTTHLTCWLAFDGANWRGQPEASLGQKSGVLLLSDAAALSPDASSATWLAASGPGSAGAAQPQLKCIPCAAPPLSRVELKELPVKNFRGPCADCCKPLAPCCCVSADGEAIFGCVPTDRSYFLPACLHMALCPQLGCDPRGGNENMADYFIAPFLVAP